MWWGLDRAGGLLYERLRPRLEQQVGRVMGHPLELGPYTGLRPWGLSAGASRFRPAADNPSSIEAAAVVVGFDPLRSLLQQAWVLQIHVRDARVQLRRNSRGSYWQLGRLPPGAEPPRLTPDGGSSPESFAAFMRAEVTRWADVVRQADIRVE